MAERTINSGQSQNDPAGSIKSVSTLIRADLFAQQINPGSTNEPSVQVPTGSVAGTRFITASIGLPSVTGEMTLINHQLGDHLRPNQNQGINTQTVQQIGLNGGGGLAAGSFEYLRDRHGRPFSIATNSEINEFTVNDGIGDDARVSATGRDTSEGMRAYSVSGSVRYKVGGSVNTLNII
jgi:hypothetical protein